MRLCYLRSCDFEDFDRGSDFYRKGDSSKTASSTSSTASNLNNSKQLTSLLGGELESVENSEDYSDLSFPEFPTAKEKDHASVTTKKIENIDPKRATLSTNTKKTTYIDAKKGNLSTLITSTKAIKTASQSAASSTGSSKTSTSSFSSRRTFPGTGEYQAGPALRIEKKSDSGNVVKRNGIVGSMARLFENMAIPASTPEENESDVSELLGSQNESPVVHDETKQNEEEDDSLDVSESDVVLDDDSGMSPSPWLMNETEKILGPRSVNADTESLNGKISRSQLSKSKQGLGGRKNGSEASYGSYGSRFSHHDVASVMSAVSSSMSTDFLAQECGEISINKAKKSLEHDLKRLEKQLAALDHDNTTTTSSITMSSITGASLTTISARSRAKLNRKKRIVVMVPPGKLGVILADR